MRTIEDLLGALTVFFACALVGAVIMFSGVLNPDGENKLSAVFNGADYSENAEAATEPVTEPEIREIDASAQQNPYVSTEEGRADLRENFGYVLNFVSRENLIDDENGIYQIGHLDYSQGYITEFMNNLMAYGTDEAGYVAYELMSFLSYAPEEHSIAMFGDFKTIYRLARDYPEIIVLTGVSDFEGAFMAVCDEGDGDEAFQHVFYGRDYDVAANEGCVPRW